jgi:signal transduction histidine kinase
MAGGQSDRARILVVDDDAERRELLRTWLEPEHEVLEAGGGRAALAAVERGGVDLVLLDVLMPDLGGIETCRALRAIRPDAGLVPVLLLSALAGPENRIEGLAAGADDYITLPCEPEELSLRIRAFLRTRRQDVTIRAQLDEMSRVTALKDDLIALVAHDLRGPLGSVLTLVRLAKEDVTDPEVRKDLEVALSAAERAREIAEDLLQVRLLEHGEHAPAREVASADEVVRDALRPLAPVARERELSVSVRAEGDTTFRFDPPLVRRAVENLLANAMRHSPQGADIDVRVRRDGTALDIDVVDRGPEIPEAVRGAVFQTFAPAARRVLTRRTYGLGLYLVRLVAEAHGGSASIHDGPDGGVLFRMRLAPGEGARPTGTAAPAGARPEASA